MKTVYKLADKTGIDYIRKQRLGSIIVSAYFMTLYKYKKSSPFSQKCQGKLEVCGFFS